MKIEIKNLYGEVLFSHKCDGNTVKNTVEKAILISANLSGANLRGAYLSGANLSGANLSGADLSGADLSGADLSGADLSRAYLRGAYLRGANLRGAYLSGANLRGASLQMSVPVIQDIHKKIYEAISKKGNALKMDRWHTCETTHCRAGWSVHLAGESGKLLEDAIGTSAAAALIYMASDPKLERIPDWLASNENAMEDIKKMAGVI